MRHKTLRLVANQRRTQRNTSSSINHYTYLSFYPLSLSLSLALPYFAFNRVYTQRCRLRRGYCDRTLWKYFFSSNWSSETHQKYQCFSGFCQNPCPPTPVVLTARNYPQFAHTPNFPQKYPRWDIKHHTFIPFSLFRVCLSEGCDFTHGFTSSLKLQCGLVFSGLKIWDRGLLSNLFKPGEPQICS